MSETIQPTTDSAGVARTATGEITTQAQEGSQATTTQETKTEQPKQQTEQKAEGKEGEKSLLNQEEKGKKVIPDTYADYKVPEGFTLDPEVKKDADALFKAAGLSQDEAQKFVDFYAAKTKEAFEQPFNAFQDTRKEWRKDAENNPTLRGKLGPGGEVLTTINKAISNLNNPKLASDFKEAMDMTGAGDNPAFIEAFYLLSQQLTEGSHVAGRGPASTGQQRPGGPPRTPASDLWPNLPSTARG